MRFFIVKKTQFNQWHVWGESEVSSTTLEKKRLDFLNNGEAVSEIFEINEFSRRVLKPIEYEIVKERY